MGGTSICLSSWDYSSRCCSESSSRGSARLRVRVSPPEHPSSFSLVSDSRSSTSPSTSPSSRAISFRLWCHRYDVAATREGIERPGEKRVALFRGAAASAGGDQADFGSNDLGSTS